eukprot:2102691-Pyramimonas_sp.AAC.1
MGDNIHDIVTRTATGSSSPAQMLQHSTDLRNDFKQIFKEHRPDGVQIGNLRAAKHRFESFQKPLGRTIRLFDLLHRLMVQVANAKRDKQGNRAMEWLTWVSESPRHILLVAMLADASDEASALTRFADVESMDVACLADHVLSFLDRSNALFGTDRLCTAR